MGDTEWITAGPAAVLARTSSRTISHWRERGWIQEHEWKTVRSSEYGLIYLYDRRAIERLGPWRREENRKRLARSVPPHLQREASRPTTVYAQPFEPKPPRPACDS